MVQARCRPSVWTVRFSWQARVILRLSPNGHGGALLAMRTSGALADMAKRGVEYISYFQSG